MSMNKSDSSVPSTKSGTVTDPENGANQATDVVTAASTTHTRPPLHPILVTPSSPPPTTSTTSVPLDAASSAYNNTPTRSNSSHQSSSPPPSKTATSAPRASTNTVLFPMDPTAPTDPDKTSLPSSAALLAAAAASSPDKNDNVLFPIAAKNSKAPGTPSRSPFRPERQEAELEALRQRGLAKLLNRHFTETTQRLAAEKAAVDAALRDLEEKRRKAAAAAVAQMEARAAASAAAKIGEDTVDPNDQDKTTVGPDGTSSALQPTSILRTSTISRTDTPPQSPQPQALASGDPSNETPGLVASPTTRAQRDDMYHRIQQMRAECQQKERETLLLYQRYVQKFGFTGQIKPPIVSSATKENDATAALYSSLVVQEEEEAEKAPEEGDTKDTEVPKAAANKKEPHEMSFTTTDQAILEESSKPTSVMAPPIMDQMQAGTAQGVPLAAVTAPKQEPEDADGMGTSTALLLSMQQQPSGRDDNDDDANEGDDDLSSLISGLTSVDSATTRQILLDCELTVATFLDEERRAVRQELKLHDEQQQRALEEGNKSKGMIPPPLSSPPKLQPLAMLSDPLDSSRDPLLITGEHDTSNLLKPSSVNTSAVLAGDSPSVAMQSLQTHAAFEAETMAEQMQQILQNYYNVQGQPPTSAAKSAMGGANDYTPSKATVTTSQPSTPAQKGRPFPTANPDEEWTVLYDDHYQRDYYHEKHSNTTQWHAPDPDATTSTAGGAMDGSSSSQYGNLGSDTPRSSSNAVLDFSEVMPDHGSLAPGTITSASHTTSTSDRIHKYRLKRRQMKRRQKRLRRMVAAGVLVVAAAAGGYYYSVHLPQQQIQPTQQQSVKEAAPVTTTASTSRPSRESPVSPPIQSPESMEEPKLPPLSVPPAVSTSASEETPGTKWSPWWITDVCFSAVSHIPFFFQTTILQTRTTPKR